MRDIVIEHGGRLYEGSIHAVSKFGALIRASLSLPLGASVKLRIDSHDDAPIVVATSVVAVIDAARAARLEIAPGLAVRYATGEEEAGRRLACEIARSPDNRDMLRRTRDMIPPILSSLRFASRRVRDDGSRLALQGDLREFDAGTLCSHAERTRRTGRLRLQRFDATATIDFIDGEIVRVQSSWERAPRRILFAVFGWSTGTFELVTMATTRTPSQQSVRVTPLLLEHIRQPSTGSGSEELPVADSVQRDACARSESFPSQ